MLIEVAYADQQRQILMEIEIPKACTLARAVEMSGILNQLTDVDCSNFAFGIHGQISDAERMLAEGERIEIYRPLSQDPMQARRQRIQR